jgi:hypothetical protein
MKYLISAYGKEVNVKVNGKKTKTIEFSAKNIFVYVKEKNGIKHSVLIHGVGKK